MTGALLAQAVISSAKEGSVRQEAQELRGAEAALSPELENQAQGQEEGQVPAIPAQVALPF